MKISDEIQSQKTINRFNTLENDFLKIHGSKYDYSLSIYKNANSKITIICKSHGEFKQKVSNHLSGQGCPKCSGKSKYTNSTFSNKANDIHGYLYDYSMVSYVNNYTNVDIICREHGIFSQRPSVHLKGHGCPECSGKLPYNTESFIKQSSLKHGNLYNYYDVDYVNSKTLVNISCKVHGNFSKTPISHLAGSGCPICSNTTNPINFINKSIIIHNNMYDYSKVLYESSIKRVVIICPKHGEFEQTPSRHISGAGCQLCSADRKSSNNTEFVERAACIHGDKYDYKDVNYINNREKVNIICYEHGIFYQTPSSHLSGSGCPDCATKKSMYDKYKNKPTTLYYVKIGDYYKVGLTQTSVDKRFAKDIKQGINVQLLSYLTFDDGYEALLEEQRILDKTIHLSITKQESPVSIGWTEVRKSCFLDIFNSQKLKLLKEIKK